MGVELIVIGLGWVVRNVLLGKEKEKKKGSFVMEQWTAAHLWFVNYKTEGYWLVRWFVGRLGAIGRAMDMQNGEGGNGGGC